MRYMKSLNALLMSLFMATTLTTSCKGNTNDRSELRDTPLATNDASTISATGNMNAPRSGHTATLLPNGQVLIAGGMERNGVFYSSAELYDPGSGKFNLTKGNMTTQRVGHIAVLL